MYLFVMSLLVIVMLSLLIIFSFAPEFGFKWRHRFAMAALWVLLYSSLYFMNIKIDAVYAQEKFDNKVQEIYKIEELAKQKNLDFSLELKKLQNEKAVLEVELERALKRSEELKLPDMPKMKFEMQWYGQTTLKPARIV